MNKNNYLKYLVPIVAVIVVAESVLLLSRMTSSNKVAPTEKAKQILSQKPVVTEKKLEEVYQFGVSANKTELKKGETAEVTVKMIGNVDKAIDSINVYLKYDPSMIEVSKLTFDKKLPVPAFNKISTLRSLVVANFLISAANGLSLKSGEELSVMKFNIRALKAGSQIFEISTGKEMKESATMIVENRTSKPLGFSSNMLTINVIQ